MSASVPILALAAAGLSAASTAYALFSALLLGQIPRIPKQTSATAGAASVAVLKPLHGAEPALRQDLESFFREAERHRARLRLGLQDPKDPARAVAETLIAAYPGLDARLVISDVVHGTNAKISNVINLCEDEGADILVLADSDIRAPDGYLSALTQALEAAGCGGVTCAYYGRPVGGFWSRLAAMGVSYQFLPGVRLGARLGVAHPCMGSTIALRREVLEAAGGFAAFRNLLADDYAIGASVRAQGLRVDLAPLLVGHSCAEATLGELFSHELRWSRTIRGLDPAGHAGSLLTHPVPIALGALAVFGPSAGGVGLLLAALLARVWVKVSADRAAGVSAGGFWLLPLRDILSAAVFAASFFGRAVEWRGVKFHVTPHGDLRPI